MLVALLALTMSVMIIPATAFADDGTKAGVSVGVSDELPAGANADATVGANVSLNAGLNGDAPAGGNADAAGANDAANDTNKCVQVKADNTEKSVEVGNIKVENGQPGIDVDALNGGKATVKAGTVVSDGGNGITADAKTLGSITVNTGNVTSVNDNGVQAWVEGEADIAITTGNISSGQIGSGIWTSVDNRSIVKDGTITVKAGDVKAEAEGIVIRPYGNGAISVEAGNVNAKGDGVQITAESGGVANLKANDIASGKSGLFVYINEGSAINALIAGTLSGEKAPITFFGSSFMNTDQFKLTAWKIDAKDGDYFFVATPTDENIELQAVSADAPLTDAEAAAKAIEQGNFALTAAEGASAFEKSILYIMKLGTAEGATLSATYADGKPLATSYDYSVAKEGERVMLKVSLEEGCELMAAYDGSGNKIELVKGDDGSYYIAYTVPKGGGLGLSVEVSSPLTSKAIDEVESALSTALAATDAVTRGVGVNIAASINASGASTIPKTGDGFPVLPFAAVALLAGAALAFAMTKRRESQ